MSYHFELSSRDEKENDCINEQNYKKITQTIAFLEKMLGEVEDNDQLFKKIGDFIKYLEE